MKLYPKKINSLDELLKEKQRLKKEMLHTGLVSFTLHDIVSETNHSKEEVAQEQSPPKEDQDDILNSILSILGENSAIAPLLEIVSPLIKKYTGKQINKIVIGVAKEVVVGYAKWKAVELSIKGVQWLIHNRKKKSK